MMLASKICITQESVANLSVYFPDFPDIPDIWEEITIRQTKKPPHICSPIASNLLIHL